MTNTNPSILKLFDDANLDLGLTYSNLKEKSRISSQLRLKWFSILFSHKTKLETKKKELDEVVQAEVAQLLMSKDYSHLPKQKVELDVKRNSKRVKDIEAEITSIQEVITFLGPVVEIFNDFGFTIKNSIESAKLDILS